MNSEERDMLALEARASTRLKPRDYLPRSDITIKRLIFLEKTVAYRVKYGCCGKESDLVHNSLMSKERIGQNLCAKCAREARKNYEKGEPFKRMARPSLSYEYGKTRTPDWPVPESVLRLHRTGSW